MKTLIYSKDHSWAVVILILLASTLFVRAESVLSLDGIDDYATAESSIIPPEGIEGGFTIEAWVFVRSPISDGRPLFPLSKELSTIVADDFYRIATDWDDHEKRMSIVFELRLGSFRGNYTSPIELNHWNHVVLQYDPDAPEIVNPRTGEIYKFFGYINGVQRKLSSLRSLTLNDEQHFTVGGAPRFDAQYLRGSVDEIRISSVARYKADFVPDLVMCADEHTMGLFRFEDRSEMGVYVDHSGNGHILKAINGALNANQARPRISLERFRIRGNKMTALVPTTPRILYSLQSTSLFNPPEWKTIQTFLGDGHAKQLQDVFEADKDSVFYRVVAGNPNAVPCE